MSHTSGFWRTTGLTYHDVVVDRTVLKLREAGKALDKAIAKAKGLN